jgi:hypothetical protein
MGRRRAPENNRKFIREVGAQDLVKSGTGTLAKISKPFLLTGGRAAKEIKAALNKLKQPLLDQLQLTTVGVESVLHEVSRRHAGENAPHHTLFGTFIEISCAILKEVMERRAEMVAANLEAAIFAAFHDIACFQGLAADGTKIVDAVKLEDFPLKPGATLPERPRRERFVSDEIYDLAIGVYCAAVADQIDPAAFVHRSDTRIGKTKYTDRTTSLKLKDGREIMLAGEEYKGRRSRGGEVQSAIRMDRILNDPDVKSTTTFDGINDDPTLLAARMRTGEGSAATGSTPTEVGNLRFNMATFTQDQILIKVTGGPSEHEFTMVRKSNSLRQRKSVYGQRALGPGRLADEGLYRYLAEFPSGDVHRLISRIERAL